jgi:hypothetical protein
MEKRHFRLFIVDFKFVIDKRRKIDERNRIALFFLSLVGFNFLSHEASKYLLHLVVVGGCLGEEILLPTLSAVVTYVFSNVYFFAYQLWAASCLIVGFDFQLYLLVVSGCLLLVVGCRVPIAHCRVWLSVLLLPDCRV